MNNQISRVKEKGPKTIQYIHNPKAKFPHIYTAEQDSLIFHTKSRKLK